MIPIQFDALARFASRYLSIAGVGMLVLGVILAYFPLHSLFVVGPLRYQVHGPRFHEGGIEALAFTAAMVVACLFTRSVLVRAVALCVIGLLYLRLYYVDLPLISSLLYMEAILAIGRLVVCGWRKSVVQDGAFMLPFICGVGVYSVLIALLSVLHLAYPGVLYATMLSLGLVSMLITRHVPYSYQAVRSGVSGNWIERLVFALLFMTVLVMAAKTNLINDYDSWWYGLRSNYVFEQGGSIFADLGLSHFVFYYPKLYEALILPLCAFPDSSYPASLNILFYVVILYIVRDMIVDMTGDRSLAALTTLITGWLPVAVFTALLVKPDLLTALVLLIAARYLMRFIIDGVLGDGFVGAAALAIALAGKLAAIPFGGLMFIAAASVAVVFAGRAMLGKGRGLTTDWSTPQLTALLLGIATFAVFTYRTYAITGLPYIAPDFLVKAFLFAGFTVHFPYAGFSVIAIGGDWHFDWQSLGTLYDAFMQPARLPHLDYSWTGNIFILTALIAALTFGQWRKTPAFWRPFLLLCLPLFLMTLMFIAFLGRQRGGAGEYYVFPIILFAAFSAASLHYARGGFRILAIAVLLLSTVSDGYVWFASTPAWSGGTAPYSTDLLKSTFDGEAQRQSVLKDNGLSKIAYVMGEAADDGHCNALADGDEAVLFKLPCAVESAHTLSVLGSLHLVNTETLSSYVAAARFDFLVIPDVPSSTLLSKVFADYTKLPGAIRIDDGLFSALDLRDVKEALPVLPVQPAEGPPSQQAVSLIQYFPELKASYPDVHGELGRPAFANADRDLKKYLAGDALVLRTSTMVEMTSDAVPFPCPGKLDFSLGLLPSDQLKGVVDAALTISWSDAQDKRILGKVDLKVNPHGFGQQEISIDKCGKRLTTITLHAYRGPNAKYAYILMTDPLLHK